MPHPEVECHEADADADACALVKMQVYGGAGSTIVPTPTASAAETGMREKGCAALRGMSGIGGEWKPCMPSGTPLMTWTS